MESVESKYGHELESRSPNAVFVYFLVFGYIDIKRVHLFLYLSFGIFT